MNKKVFILIIVILVIGAGLGIYFINNIYRNSSINSGNENDDKILILYFSATGNTKKIAKYIKNATNGDIEEIIPTNEYTSDDLNYTNDDCRASKEQNDSNIRPEIKNSINIENYDTIYLGYPIWFGNVPKIILTLLDSYNFDEKTVIPFCTSGSTGIEQSESTLKSYNDKINWINGKRFSSNASQDEISSWIKKLEYDF